MAVNMPRFVQVDDKSFAWVRDELVEAHLVEYDEKSGRPAVRSPIPYVEGRPIPYHANKGYTRGWHPSERDLRQKRLMQQCREESGIIGLVKAIWAGGYHSDGSIWTCTIRGGTETRGKLTVNKPFIVNGETLDEVTRRLLDELTPKESLVLRLRYGLAEPHCKTLEDIARVMDRTRERVRQIEAKALRKLRYGPGNEQIRPFVIEEIYSGK